MCTEVNRRLSRSGVRKVIPYRCGSPNLCWQSPTRRIPNANVFTSEQTFVFAASKMFSWALQRDDRGRERGAGPGSASILGVLINSQRIVFHRCLIQDRGIDE
jgi:hypothetical protein